MKTGLNVPDMIQSLVRAYTEGSGHVTFHTSGCTKLQLPYVFLQWKRLNCIKWWCSECKLAEHILCISPKLSKLTSKYWANITVGLCQDRSYYDAIEVHFHKGCQIKGKSKSTEIHGGGNICVVDSSLTFLPVYLQIFLKIICTYITTQGYHWWCTNWWALV